MSRRRRQHPRGRTPSPALLAALQDLTDLWSHGGDINRPDGFVVLFDDGCWRLHVDAWIYECVAETCPDDAGDARLRQEAMRRGAALGRQWQREAGAPHAGFWAYPHGEVYGVTWRLLPTSCSDEWSDEDTIDLRASTETTGTRPSMSEKRKRTGPRPREVLQQEKMQRWMAEDLFDRPESSMWDTPEGELPPKDEIFSTAVWVNCYIRNFSAQGDSPRRTPVAALGAYTQRQAERLLQFAEQFYSTAFPPDSNVEAEALLENQWAFDLPRPLSPEAVVRDGGEVLRLVNVMLEHLPFLHAAVTASPHLRQFRELIESLAKLDQDTLRAKRSCVDLQATLLPLDLNTKAWPWVIAGEVTRHYGGPEEGGWWYNHFEPIAGMLVPDPDHRKAVERVLRDQYESLVGYGDIYSVHGGAEFSIIRSNRPPKREGPPDFE